MMISRLPLGAALVALACVGFAGCADDAAPRETFEEAAAKINDNVLEFMGEAVRTRTTEQFGVTTHVFDPESGPVCIDGSEFETSFREGTSNDLAIFLMGGGACWSDVCIRTESAAGGPLLMSALGVISNSEARTPFYDWDTVFVPYCDGSLFAGNAEYDDDDDGEIDRIQHGIQNLSAALDVALELNDDPDRILLTGVSAGGFGTILSYMLVRKLYPRARIFVFNDSGVGVAGGEADPDLVDKLIIEWNLDPFIPEDCQDCFDDGHLTEFIAWQLENDPGLKMSSFSYTQDDTIGNTFLRLGGEVFEEYLLEEIPALHERFPDSYVHFILQGDGHTLLGDIAGNGYNGLTVRDWLQAMLDGDPAWQPVVEPPED